MTRTADARLILAHGFTQTARSWDLVSGLLAEREIVSDAVDLPGHGTAAAGVAGVVGEGRRMLKSLHPLDGGAVGRG